jgi:UDP-sugar diphosphatase
MRNRNCLVRAGKKLSIILPAILVIASFLIAPAGVSGVSGGNDELYFTILHTNDMHSELIPHSPAVDYGSGGEDSTIGGFARLATAVDEIRQTKAGAQRFRPGAYPDARDGI